MAKPLVMTVATHKDGSRELLYLGDDANAGVSAGKEALDPEIHTQIDVFRQPHPFRRLKPGMSEVVHHTPLGADGVYDPAAEPEIADEPETRPGSDVIHHTPLGADGKLRKVKPTTDLAGGQPSAARLLPEPAKATPGANGPWHPTQNPAIQAKDKADRAAQAIRDSEARFNAERAAAAQLAADAERDSAKSALDLEHSKRAAAIDQTVLPPDREKVEAREKELKAMDVPALMQAATAAGVDFTDYGGALAEGEHDDIVLAILEKEFPAPASPLSQTPSGAPANSLKGLGK